MNDLASKFKILRYNTTGASSYRYGMKSKEFIFLPKSCIRTVHFKRDGYYYTYFMTSPVVYDKLIETLAKRHDEIYFWENPDYVALPSGDRGRNRKYGQFSEPRSTKQFLKRWEESGRKVLTAPNDMVL